MSKGNGSAGRAGVSATTGNGKNGEVERLGGNVEIRYKNTVQQVRGSDQRGLQLQSQYYAELYKNGERIAWTSAESGGKDLFEEKINSWRSEYSKEKDSQTSNIKSAASYTTRFNDVFKSAPAKGGSREITSPDGTSVLINHVDPGYGSGGIFNVVIRKEGGEAERYAYRYGSSGMADAGTKASAWKRAKDTAASASQYYQKKRS